MNICPVSVAAKKFLLLFELTEYINGGHNKFPDMYF